MTESLVRSLNERIGLEVAPKVYRDLWKALERRGYDVRVVEVDRDSLLPLVSRRERRAFEIPNQVIIAVSKDSGIKSLVDDALKKRRDLNRVNIVKAVDEQIPIFGMDREEKVKKKEALGALARFTLLAASLKVEDALVQFPPLIDGRLVDFLAVPVFASISRVTNYGDSDSRDIAIGLTLSFGTEFAQKFGLVPGTFDEGDLVSYALGAIGYAFYRKLQSNRRKARSI